MSFSDFSAARRIPLVGRRDFLKDASRRLQRGGAHLLYYEGEGGIGKTALLETILARCQREGSQDGLPEGHIAREIIDLYHVDAHTPEGLMRRIVQVLGTRAFRQTQKNLSTLDWARSVGNVDQVRDTPNDLQTTFLEEFQALAEEGVVLALDTMEVLQHERDPFQAELGKKVPILSVGEWLFESFFPNLKGNCLILLAGRPDGVRHRLRTLRERNPSLQLRTSRVDALQKSETIEYLKAVAELEVEQGNFDAATRLWEFGDERGDIVHLLTRGRPILLALVADMVAHGWTLPPSFGRTLEELKGTSADEQAQEIESALVMRIQESPSPLGEVIHTLSWLRKGATPTLLARVMDLKASGGGWDLGSAQEYLAEAARLTLVKVRAGDGRVFLHDELYALQEKHVLGMCSPEERDRIYRAVLIYYDELASDLQRRVDRSALILPLIHARLRGAYAEQMHYQLRYRSALGFAMYFWLAEEALRGRDAEMDMLLRTELLRTVRLLESFSSQDELKAQEVELDTAVRWGMRALFLQDDPGGALGIFDRLEAQWPLDAGPSDLARLHMQLYRAAAQIERAEEDDWERARALLKNVQQETEALPGEHPMPAAANGLFWWVRSAQDPPADSKAEGQQLLAWTLKAMALDYEGYLDHQQGRYAEAMVHYQASAMLQRRLAMAGLAPTLTNLSYTMALIGQFQNARLLAQEAERWARHSGQEYVLALALNAQALVEAYDNHPRDALRYAHRGLEIVKGLHAPRARGLLLLTRARAHRYLLRAEDRQRRDPQALDEALKEANLAVNLLKSGPIDRVNALIERGCLHRGIARTYYARQQETKAVRAARGSQRDLERAAALAGAIGLPDQQALALTDLGWLWYYTGQTRKAQHALRQAKDAVPSEYLLPDQGGLPPVAESDRRGEASLPFWSTLGKGEMLRAYMALDQGSSVFGVTERESWFQEAVRHITCSLAYNELFADEHFFMTRAEESLHGRILCDKINIGDLHLHAQTVADELRLAQPTRFQRFLSRLFGPAELWD